jgi:erythromycin esterase
MPGVPQYGRPAALPPAKEVALVNRTTLTILLFALLSAACAAPVEQAPAPQADRLGTSEWHSAVAAAAGERRVLQLGESGHGMAETYRLKTGLVRYLHQSHGFDVLAVEGGMAECWVTSRRLAEWTAEQSMRACFWGSWASEEAEELFEYLRETARSGRPLRLVGFDNIPTSRAFLDWLMATPGLPPELLEAERDFISLVERRQEEPAARVRTQRRAADNYQLAYAAVNDPELRMIIADRLGTLDFDPAGFDAEEFEAIREFRMAANLLAHMDREAGARIIVWAHNAHVAHNYSNFVGGVPRQGEYLHRIAGDQVYTIGIYPFAGRGFAWFINQDYDLSTPPPGSLEARLAALPGDPVFLDLRGEQAAALRWTREPVASYEWGLNEQVIVPVEMYDGLLLIRSVTPITRPAN